VKDEVREAILHAYSGAKKPCCMGAQHAGVWTLNKSECRKDESFLHYKCNSVANFLIKTVKMDATSIGANN
jgi:hypothetical protein